MVKENELRIGNWVMCEDGQTESLTNRFVKVKTMAGKYIHWESPFTIVGSGRCVGGTKYADADPIPLTPEILEKAGFKLVELRYPQRFYYSLGCINIYKRSDSFEYSVDCDEHIHCSGTQSRPIKFVHQLQNLYFALTGEELEITL